MALFVDIVDLPWAIDTAPLFSITVGESDRGLVTAGRSSLGRTCHSCQIAVWLRLAVVPNIGP